MATNFFSLGNTLALVAWAGLLLALFLARVRPFVVPAIRFFVPALFGLAYIALLATSHPNGGGFNSIAEVRALFADDNALTAGWLHYLAFDLFVGTWIVEDAAHRGVIRLLVVPCLALTFLFGPVGYLLYMALRLTRRPAAKA